MRHTFHPLAKSKHWRKLRHWTLLRLKIFPRTIVVPVDSPRSVAQFKAPADAYVAAVLDYDPATIGDAYVMLEVIDTAGAVVGRRKVMRDRSSISALFSTSATASYTARFSIVTSDKPLPIRVLGFTVKKLRERLAAPAVHFGDNSTTVALATFPPRRALFADTFPTIRDQADNTFIYLNNYQYVPDFLHVGRAHYILDTASCLKAAAKFNWCRNSGYHFLVDDDIFYPPDYVEKMVKAVERYRRRAIVGVHGILLQEQVTRFPYRTETMNFYRALDADQGVHVLGSGTVGFHSDTVVSFPWALLREHVVSNDETLAVMARSCGVPMIAVAREHNWLRSHPQMNFGIFEEKGLQPGLRTPALKLLKSQNPWPAPQLPAQQSEAA